MQIKFTNKNTKQRIRIENNESENSTDEKRQLQIGKDKANVKTDQRLKKAQQGIRKHNESEKTTANQKTQQLISKKKQNNESENITINQKKNNNYVVLSIKITNRTGDKGQPCRSPTCTGNRSDLLPAMRTKLLLRSYRDRTALTECLGPHTPRAPRTECYKGHSRTHSPGPQNTCGLVGRTPTNPRAP